MIFIYQKHKKILHSNDESKLLHTSVMNNILYCFATVYEYKRLIHPHTYTVQTTKIVVPQQEKANANTKMK
jgi:hypothetical protein